MSEYNSGDHCPDCDGSDGNHFPGCDYDGTKGGRGYSRGSGPSFFKFIAILVLGFIGVLCLLVLVGDLLASPALTIIVIELLVVGVVVGGLLFG